MWIGDVVADRFVIECPAVSGGMSSVFRAMDRVTGERVAVKVMDDDAPSAGDRFRLETNVLSELSHPAIVRYIAHGETESGDPFLVMEWLKGHDLAERLAGAGLTADESLAVVRRVAEGLGVAHVRGIVHRDIKPSNIFLVDGDPRRAKVLDFGVARVHSLVRPLTRTGSIIGTVGYMSPEQASGADDVEARADVFSLGCVLFECLTGRPAFAGRHAVAVLAKVLHEKPPRVSELRPALGDALDPLVASMLSKEREGRPRDASALLGMLQSLESIAAAAPAARPRAQTGVTDAERRVVSIILAAPAAAEPQHAPVIDADRMRRKNDELSRLAAKFGAELTHLEGGALLVVFRVLGTAADLATRAADYALALRQARPELRIAVSTGRAETVSRTPIGPAIDGAAAILHDLAWGEGETIRVDDLTAGLLDARFRVESDGSTRVLVDKDDEFEAGRQLLGKSMPCVGRDKEIALLDATLDECIDDSVSRAVIVVAPAGTGKSRLAREFLQRARMRDKIKILLSRAEPLAVGSPLALARSMLRRAAAIRDDEPAEVRRTRLSAHLRAVGGAAGLERLGEFLGEMIETPVAENPSPILCSARLDSALMREQQRRAFLGWLDAQTSTGPLLVVIEDLQWGDSTSVEYLEEALRTFADRSLFVVALGRPELYGQFPRLRETGGLQEVRLGGLTRRAAERLVRVALGESVETDVVERIVQLADGNAFYLEELIRRVAEHESQLPETVLAMAQSRLDRLEPDARRVLRAASVFGETFWTDAVTALLIGDPSAGEWLEALTSRELLIRAPESRFGAQREYAFRHSLLRDAAYAMLTDDDRMAAHALAGQWLEQAGETNGRVLAEHFERGGEPVRALPWVQRAAKTALDAGDVKGAVELATRGVQLGADGESRGLLLAIHAEALSWDAQWDTVLSVSREARSFLPRGTAPWWRATAAFVAAATAGGKPAEAAPIIQSLLSAPPDLTGQPLAAARACNWIVIGLINIGQGDRAVELMDRIGVTKQLMDRIGRPDSTLSNADPVFLAWLMHAACGLAILVDADLGRAMRMGTWARGVLAEVGDTLGVASLDAWLGAAAWETGRVDDTESHWLEVKRLLGRSGGSWLPLYAEFYLAAVRLRRGQTAGIEETIAPVRASADFSASQLAHALTVELRLREGRIDEAQEAANVAASGPSAVVRPTGAAILARLHLALGRFREALEAADRGLAESSTINPQWKTWLLVARAEALNALGESEAARGVAAEAAARVRRIAETLGDAGIRESFLTNVEANARALALERQYG
jgi:eukaryotic-like serine/threonine-protein kinase